MRTPRFLSAFRVPRRSFLNAAAVTLSSFTAGLWQARSAEPAPPIGDGKLRIIVFGAHPDDCEFSAGGTGAKWAAQGHHVKFVSCTNGDIGHWSMAGGPLARRRAAEVHRR
ncbi:MAG TPA: PIG-L family deacetylase, partial [Candidatus Paceibacterota bacterium]|nr:PIG-L family deacetylase [Candidatus Paceibacterota bacterium]